VSSAAELIQAQLEAHKPESSEELLTRLWRPVGADVMSVAPPARMYLLRHPDGTGLLPLGRAGMLAAEGGCGKTSAIVSLAVSVACGRPWLGHFRVPEGRTGRVLLLLGEEDQDEIHRRVWEAARGLSPEDRQLCAERIVAVPLAGESLRLTEVVAGQLTETPALTAVRNRLRSGGEWSLVAIDPMSRFAGGDPEGANDQATRFMQAVESLTHAPGNPTALVSAHSSKIARRSGTADVRGVTGLTDAARWVATLCHKGGDVLFEQVKSNYSIPMSEPLRLRWVDGVLEALTAVDLEVDAAQQRAEQDRELEADITAIVEALRREGAISARDSVVRAAGLRSQRGRAALDLAIARNLVVRDGTARKPEHRLAVPEGVCAAPPYTPGTAGTAKASPPSPSGGRPGRRRDGDGTAGRRSKPEREPWDEHPFEDPNMARLAKLAKGGGDA
jgi:hypothetical protein